MVEGSGKYGYDRNKDCELEKLLRRRNFVCFKKMDFDERKVYLIDCLYERMENR
jgi:hypothetical protein